MFGLTLELRRLRKHEEDDENGRVQSFDVRHDTG